MNICPSCTFFLTFPLLSFVEITNTIDYLVVQTDNSRIKIILFRVRFPLKLVSHHSMFHDGILPPAFQISRHGLEFGQLRKPICKFVRLSDPADIGSLAGIVVPRAALTSTMSLFSLVTEYLTISRKRLSMSVNIHSRIQNSTIFSFCSRVPFLSPIKKPHFVFRPSYCTLCPKVATGKILFRIRWPG